MRFSLASTLVVALAAQGTVASTWFGKAAYDKWHQTELERWLSDYGVPYSKPSDRKDLENLVKSHWNDKVVQPYNSWDTKQLQNYLSVKGYQAKKGTEKNKDSLVDQVKGYWTQTEESTNSAYANTKDWIFDTWTESQLKAFADKHGIPVPQPRKRDTLLQTLRENYQSAANKVNEYTAYPGDWIYESWSDSDLKAWLDERGLPAPQPSSRDQLIASVRRNSYLASQNAKSTYAQASSSAANAQQSLSDALLDSWSDSQIKEWADKNGIKVPQGSKRNELLALARKHAARLTGDNVSASGASAYGAATSKAGNQYAQATAGFGYYTDLIKQQIGLAQPTGAEYYSSLASASYASASSAAAKSGGKAASSASKSAKSAYEAASKSAASASASIKQEL